MKLKNIVKLIENKILIEGLSDILYNKTNIDNAYQILKSDKFKLSVTSGTPSDQHGSKLYFFSMARNLSSSYFNVHEFSVIFKLDGRKLKQNYKGRPVGYWDMKKTGRNEEEDRIVTDEPYIKNATKYIDELHILLPTKFNIDSMSDRFSKDVKFSKQMGRAPTEQEKIDLYGGVVLKKLDDKQSSLLRKLILECKKNNIDFYSYTHKSDMKLARKDKAVKLSDINLSGKYAQNNYNQFKRKGYIDDVLELYFTPKQNKNKLSDSALDYIDTLYRMQFGEHVKKDIIDSLKTDIHNKRNTGYKSVERISKLIRKYNGIENLLLYINDKWNKH